MNNLVVTIREEVLVVESKLVAEELGIQHKNFLATIDKYADKMAQSTVVKAPAFETRVLERPQGGSYEERICWLTEPQAIFLMTLSRNTKRVVSCKLKLVEAFEEAKQRIATLETAPTTLTNTITIALEQALTPINQQLNEIQQQLKSLPGTKPKRPWILPSNTPLEEIPEGYQQLEDGSWLSPEAYQSILRQGRRSLSWELRNLRNFE